MKLPLAYYGDPILRKKCAPVVEITAEIRQLVLDMVDTMEANNGIGLAAPQVSRPLRLFITRFDIENKDEEESVPGELRVFINPEILEISEELSYLSEGCLSIPKLYGEVERPYRVRVRATDLEGKVFEEEFTGLHAHCILHENDHINGVLFIDRIHGREKIEIEPKLREIKNKFYKKK